MLCSKCGRELSGGDISFCPFCGAELAKEAVNVDADWYIARLKDSYDSYIKWHHDFYANRGRGAAALALFTGNSAYKNSPQHDEFFNTAKEYAGALAELFAADSSLASKAEEALRFGIFDCHDCDLKDADLMFLAAEQLYLPFVDCISSAAAEDIYEKYRKLRKRSPGFKPQEDMLKKLKKATKGA